MAARRTEPRGGSIRLRAAVLTSALIAIALIAVIAYTFVAVRTSLVRAGEARASAAATQIAGIIAAPLPARLSEVQRLVDNPSVRDLLTTRSPAAEAAVTSRLKTVLANAAQHQSLELWTIGGQRVFALQVPPTGGSVPLADSMPPGVGVLPYAVVNGVVISAVAVEVRSGGAGTPVLGHLLSRRVATNPNTPDTLSRLLGGGGRVLFGNQAGPVWTDIATVVDPPPIDASVAGVHHYRGTDGLEKIAAVTTLPGMPLAVVVEFPMAQVVAPAWALLRQLSLVGLIFTLIAVATVWRLSANVTRPLEQLAEALRGISGGDFERRVTTNDHDEVGRLGEAFNAMAAKIQAGLHELDAQARAREESLRRSLMLQEENRRVQEASRLKSEFLANMSHELRTPLNAIIGFAELLHDGQVTPDMPQFKEFMHDILTSGQHLLQLINDVLDLSKVEAGRLDFHPEQTDLPRVVAESINVLRTLAAQKQLTIDHEIDPAAATAFVDRARLKQVLYNYLSNAIKFTPERGRVQVRVTPDAADRFRIEVTDTGIGISAADQSRLFVEFNQLEAGAAKKHQGTGLGLALTKRLIEAQGGSVGVRSAPGEGSTFFAVLPRRATRGTPIPGPRSIAAQRLGAPSVLVIEDNSADQETIVRALVNAGFNVETATTRAQAIVKLDAQSFDAITLDLILPDASGADILHDLRNSERNRHVPVVVITVVARDGAVAGFAVHDILSKPVDGPSLVQALMRAGVSAAARGNVLVVDDDPGSLRLMAASLGQLGYASTCVERAMDGLRLCELKAPLAVVLDLQMPEMDGFGFLEHFRKLPACTHTPVIVWTVRDLTADDYARLRSSVQGVIAKGQSASASVVDELRRFTVQRQA